MKKLIEALRISKHDFVNHTFAESLFYLVVRGILLIASYWLPQEYLAIASCAGSIFIGGLCLEVYQNQSDSGKAQAHDYLAVFLTGVCFLIADFSLWEIPGYSFMGAGVYILSGALLWWTYLYFKTKP